MSTFPGVLLVEVKVEVINECVYFPSVLLVEVDVEVEVRQQWYIGSGGVEA